MTPEEKAEFLRLAAIAVHDELMMPTEEHEKDLFRMMQEMPEFIDLIRAGTREFVREARLSKGSSRAESMLTVSVEHIFTSLGIAISVGMDLAITMQRFGVKFPEPKRIEGIYSRLAVHTAVKSKGVMHDEKEREGRFSIAQQEERAEENREAPRTTGR